MIFLFGCFESAYVLKRLGIQNVYKSCIWGNMNILGKLDLESGK